MDRDIPKKFQELKICIDINIGIIMYLILLHYLKILILILDILDRFKLTLKYMMLDL